ncbi:MAG: fibronectin type III domain-containing protein [Deltaproteobacteria bacterium]|nr:fibronectin type III domain-containing protein [Deltaproteobacteria bacterium]
MTPTHAQAVRLVLTGSLLFAACQQTFLHRVREVGSANVAAGEPPGAPADLTATGGPASIVLSWTPDPAAATFNLYWSQSPAVSVDTAERIANVSQPYTHSGLLPGVTYYYVVTGTNAAGEGPPSAEAAAAAQYPPPCGPDLPPLALVAVQTTNGIELSWTCDATDEGGFVIYRQRLGAEWGEQDRLDTPAAEGGIAVTFTDTAFAADTTYRYRVTAFGLPPAESNCETIPSNIETLLTWPSPPASVVAGPRAADVMVVAWEDTNANESGYRIERFDGAGFVEIAAPGTTATLTHYDDVGRAHGTTYRYRVTAVSPSGESTGVEVEGTTSLDPTGGLTPGAAHMAPGCRLIVPGTAAADATTTLVAGPAIYLPPGNVSGTVTLATTSSYALTGVEAGFAPAAFPTTAFAIDVTWTVIDSVGGRLDDSSVVAVTPLVGQVRSPPRRPTLTIGDDAGEGRQALWPACGDCTGRMASIAMGDGHTCAIVGPGGGVECWGAADRAQLGDGHGYLDRSANPVPACMSGFGNGCTGGAALSGVTDFDVYDSGGCAVKGGGVWCWGGAAGGAALPVAIGGLAGVQAVAVGRAHACAVVAGGEVRCWGANNAGQLGNGSTADSATPMPVCATASSPPACDAVLTGATEIDAGGDYTCALRTTGQAYCWGARVDATCDSVTRPELPAPMGNGCSTPFADFTEVRVGARHACGVRGATNEVWCWGDNADGRVTSPGDAPSGSSVPRATCESGAYTSGNCTPLTGITSIAAGAAMSCGRVAATGEIRCWGSTAPANLELVPATHMATICTSLSPCVPLAGAGSVAVATDVSGSTSHVCAVISATGEASCVGTGGSGELGGGIAQDSLTAVTVCASGAGASCTPLTGIAAASAGSATTCARTTAGALQCWGHAVSGGAIPVGVWETRAAPTDVCLSGRGPGCVGGIALTDARSITSSATHSCAVTGAGALHCWGGRGGLLGSGAPFADQTPIVHAVAGCETGSGATCLPFANLVAAASGRDFSCVLNAVGRVLCWGRGDLGQLGNGLFGGTEGESRPQDVICGLRSGQGCTAGLAVGGLVNIAAGDAHACAVTSSGGVKCWGAGAGGQLGDGTDSAQNQPTEVCASGINVGSGCPGTALADVTSVVTGNLHTCALGRGGDVLCWGDNSFGQLGVGVLGGKRLNPTPVCLSGSGAACPRFVSPPIALAAGAYHTCALLASGEIWCWGDNTSGQLGPNAAIAIPSQNPLLTVTGAVAVAAADATCAVVADASMRCWGRNNTGQLGDRTTTSSAQPVTVCASGSGPGCPAWQEPAVATCDLYDAVSN